MATNNEPETRILPMAFLRVLFSEAMFEGGDECRQGFTVREPHAQHFFRLRKKKKNDEERGQKPFCRSMTPYPRPIWRETHPHNLKKTGRKTIPLEILEM